MSQRHENTLDATHCALLVIDVQEKFRPAMADFDEMLAGCVRLVRTFRALDLPIIVTEQYPRGLGHTVDVLREALPEDVVIPEKTRFSSLGCEAAADQLSASGCDQVLVCGIETHVCVNQTVHDLLADGNRVHVALDAIASRRPSDRDVALRRMAAAGTVLTTSEMAAFELLVDAKHEKFREVQGLFR